jgi:hypothetical protein
MKEQRVAAFSPVPPVLLSLVQHTGKSFEGYFSLLVVFHM